MIQHQEKNSISATSHISKHYLNAGKAFIKIKHLFITLKKPQDKKNRKELTLLDKIYIQKPIVNIMLNGETLDAFPVTLKTMQGFPEASLLLT